jgi:hypothetical protein
LLRKSPHDAIRALLAAERLAPKELAELPLAMTVLDDVETA